MANRRMFSRAITGSGRFLRLSAQARALYYDLGMEADDDGFVEAFVRLRATGAEEVQLRELEQAGLILVLDEYNLVVYIQDWSINNTIRRDRYTPSIYQSLYLQFAQAAEKPEYPRPEPDEEPEDIQPEADEEPEPAGQPSGNQPATGGQPGDNQRSTTGFSFDAALATQVRSGKDRVEKDRKEKNMTAQKNIGHNSSGAVGLPRACAREGGQPSERGMKTTVSWQNCVGNSWYSSSIAENSEHFDDYPPWGYHAHSMDKSVSFL